MDSRCFSPVQVRNKDLRLLTGMFPCCIPAIQTCLQHLSLGLLSPHREARLRRKELRQKQQVEVKDLEEKMKRLQAANEHKQQQLEDMRKVASSEACVWWREVWSQI